MPVTAPPLVKNKKPEKLKIEKKKEEASMQLKKEPVISVAKARTVFKPKSPKQKANWSNPSNSTCSSKVASLVAKNPITFKPNTPYIEFKTGDVIEQIGKALKSCPRAKIVVTGVGYDELAGKRANTVATFLKDIYQIPQVVSTKTRKAEYGISPIQIQILNK